MSVTVGDYEIVGPVGTAIGCFTVLFVGAIFLFIALILLSPVIVPVIVAFLIGKAL